MPFSFGFPALGGAESSESEPRSGGQEGKMKGPEGRLSQGKEPEPEAVALARTLCSEGTRSEALR